jgi:hypothetical protein
VSVNSVNQDGASILGYRTVLYGSAGGIIAQSFSPNAFVTTVGDTYSVRAESYGICTFTRWSDGVTSDPRTFTATSSATVFTAVYDCRPSTLTVDSVNQNGTAISGYYVAIGGPISTAGYTPFTSSTTVGDLYFLHAENYGSCTYNHLSTGATYSSMLTANATDATITVVYYCAP